MSTVPEVTVDHLAHAMTAGDAYVLDVRESDEYTAGHVPGAQHVPLAQLSARLAEVRGSDALYVVCASGGRSKVATEVLRAAGREAYSVAGGTTAWQKSGHRTVTGPRP